VRLGFRRDLEAIADEAERKAKVRELTALPEQNARPSTQRRCSSWTT
jgi:hypothetical protein